MPTAASSEPRQAFQPALVSIGDYDHVEIHVVISTSDRAAGFRTIPAEIGIDGADLSGSTSLIARTSHGL
jgi:hypothetical protein